MSEERECNCGSEFGLVHKPDCPAAREIDKRWATPTPARSEAQWGEPRPDCPRCHGTGTYRLTPDSRLRPCRCGLSERSEAAGGESLMERVPRVTCAACQRETPYHSMYRCYQCSGWFHEACMAEHLASTHNTGDDRVTASLRQQLAAAREEREAWDFKADAEEAGRTVDIVPARGIIAARRRKTYNALREMEAVIEQMVATNTSLMRRLIKATARIAELERENAEAAHV